MTGLMGRLCDCIELFPYEVTQEPSPNMANLQRSPPVDSGEMSLPFGGSLGYQEDVVFAN